MKILITGSTGFLGSHIAELLVNLDYDVFALKRKTSNIDILPFCHNVKWYNIEDNWIEEAISFSPEIILHTAWSGVDSISRNDWEEQLSNIPFVNNLLEIARLSHSEKFISLGSQAECGFFSGKIDENQKLNPVTAYGAVKCSISKGIQSFCEIHDITWVWLRVFSVFGERESDKWLITNTILRLLNGEVSFDFSEGKQKYAYIYVKDFASAVLSVINGEKGCSGVYNLSSANPLELKKIIIQIRDMINPLAKLNFGVISYRPNQSMHIEGDMTKFSKEFGPIKESNFKEALEQLIIYHKNSSVNEGF